MGAPGGDEPPSVPDGWYARYPDLRVLKGCTRSPWSSADHPLIRPSGTFSRGGQKKLDSVPLAPGGEGWGEGVEVTHLLVRPLESDAMDGGAIAGPRAVRMLGIPGRVSCTSLASAFSPRRPAASWSLGQTTWAVSTRGKWTCTGILFPVGAVARIGTLRFWAGWPVEAPSPSLRAYAPDFSGIWASTLNR